MQCTEYNLYWRCSESSINGGSILPWLHHSIRWMVRTLYQLLLFDLAVTTPMRCMKVHFTHSDTADNKPGYPTHSTANQTPEPANTVPSLRMLFAMPRLLPL